MNMTYNEIIAKDFDRIALLDENKWDHNRFYHEYLLKFLPVHMEKVLEVGCGTGEFSRLLIKYAGEVIALDISEEMLAKARSMASQLTNITYVKADFMSYDIEPESYDSIVTIATAHHLPLEEFFIKAAIVLKPGGSLIVLDLFLSCDIMDYLFDFISVPLNILTGLIKTGHFKESQEEKAAWKEHQKNDTYMALKEIKRIADKIITGADIKRLLFWRYSLVWKK